MHVRQRHHGFHSGQRPQFLHPIGRHAHEDGIHENLHRAGDGDMTAREFVFEAALRGRDRLHVLPGRRRLQFGARVDLCGHRLILQDERVVLERRARENHTRKEEHCKQAHHELLSAR